MELTISTDTELSPPNPIRVETALSRYPVHRLAKHGDIAIDIREMNEQRRAFHQMGSRLQQEARPARPAGLQARYAHHQPQDRGSRPADPPDHQAGEPQRDLPQSWG